MCSSGGTKVLTNTAADAFIDNFEEAAGLLPGWSSAADVAADAGTWAPLGVATGGAAGTAHSGHYAGTGASQPPAGWGVNTVFNEAINGSGQFCVDISAFDGVSFWGMAASAAKGNVSLNFVIPSLNPTSAHGDCTDTTKCYNYPRKSFTFTTTWTQYTETFAEATGGAATVGSVLQEIEFISSDSNWDFSVDEITFYKGTPPAGAISQ